MTKKYRIPSPDTTNKDGGEHLLTVWDITYTVSTWSRSWWQCGCVRRSTKRILNHLNLSFRSGQVAGFIGNSVDICSMDYRSGYKESKSTETVQQLVQAFRNSDQYKAILKDILVNGNKDVSHRASRTRPTCNYRTFTQGAAAIDIHEPARHRHACNYFWTSVGSLISRMYLHISRDRRGFMNRIMNMTLYALFIWMFCWRLDLDTKSIQDRLGIIYLIISVSCAVGMLTAYNNYPQHRDLYYRESDEGLYNCVHFLVAYFLHILPFQIFSSLAFISWTYWSVGMYPDVSRFLICALVSMIQQHLGELQTVACMALVFDNNTARSMANMLITISSQYASGLLKSTESLIAPLQYLTYINHYKYAAQVLVVNEFEDLMFECHDKSANCTMPGEVVIEWLYPGAIEDKATNLGILGAMVGAYWIIVILIYIARGRKILH